MKPPKPEFKTGPVFTAVALLAVLALMLAGAGAFFVVRQDALNGQREYRQAQEKGPGELRAEARRSIARATELLERDLVQKKDLQEALQGLKEGEGFPLDDPTRHILAVWIHLQLNEDQEASDEADRALAIAPLSGEALFLQGWSTARLVANAETVPAQDLSEAERWWRRARQRGWTDWGAARADPRLRQLRETHELRDYLGGE